MERATVLDSRRQRLMIVAAAVVSICGPNHAASLLALK